jgi:hypothetical protein
LSPRLFILADVVLIKFFLGEFNMIIFSGLDLVLSNGHQLLNSRYADDTLMLLKSDSAMIECVKWALKGFEGFSRLKNKFANLELIPLNLSNDNTLALSNLLQCKVGKLSLKYSGLPLH